MGDNGDQRARERIAVLETQMSNLTEAMESLGNKVERLTASMERARGAAAAGTAIIATISAVLTKFWDKVFGS